MTLAYFAMWVAVAFALSFVTAAVLRRMRMGRFVVRRDNTQAFGFETDFGRFHVDRTRGVIVATGKRAARTIAVADVVRLRYLAEERWAILEEWFMGLDLTDFLDGYRDLMHWHTIALELADGTQVPVFTAGEYEPREFLMGWYLDLQAGLLQRVGLMRDVSEYARGVCDRLRDELLRSGAQLQPGTA
jgi:hypothetical protein